MGCRLAENEPLKQLSSDLGLPAQCHSFRKHCLEGHQPRGNGGALGVPGAVIGYCQALMNRAGDPRTHTRHVQQILADIGAPWFNSHELYWGLRDRFSTHDFIELGIEPLAGCGRVPILITPLDPSKDYAAIDEIVTSRPAIHDGETILFRIVLADDVSIAQSAALLRRLLAQSRTSRQMPVWWPLLQGTLSVEQWESLRCALGSDWRYVNVAVNPFTPEDVFNCVASQITVAQLPIGLDEGIGNDGWVKLASRMKITGATDGATYSTFEFAARLSELDIAPTLVVLGQSLPEWSVEVNRQRIEKFLPILRASCDIIWQDVPESRRQTVWKMPA